MIGKLRRVFAKSRRPAALSTSIDRQSKLLEAGFQNLIQGMDNQSRMFAERFDHIIQGLDNQSRMLAERLDHITQGLDNQSRLMSERFEQLVQGIANQSQMLAERHNAIIYGIEDQSRSANQRFTQLLQAIDNQSRLIAAQSASSKSQGTSAAPSPSPRGADRQTPSIVRSDTDSPPDYQYGTLAPEEFRHLLLDRGAVMLRKAADPALLDRIQEKIDELFARYGNAQEIQGGAHPANAPPVNYDDFWNQLKRSHIFDQTFKQLCGLSYYDIIRSSGIWDFAARAFWDCKPTESADCNSRRTTIGELPIFYDAPIDFHVDAQFHFIHQLSINFWTPLSACGRDAPGLQVVLLGVDQTKKYLEFSMEGYEPEPSDIDNMRHFRCYKQQIGQLKDNNLQKYLWTPEFEKGDILAFTNFTMHATYFTPEMTKPRTSIEVRVSLPTIAS